MAKIVAVAYPPNEISKFGAPAGAGLVLGGLPAGLLALSEGARMVEKYFLPDFGELVLDAFLTHARNEIRSWPEVSVEKDQEKARKLSEGHFLLEIRPNILRVRYWGVGKDGFHAMTTARLKDSAGEVMWQSTFMYMSGDYGRDANVEHWEEDRGKLLKEEWAFAAEETARKFLNDLRNP